MAKKKFTKQEDQKTFGEESLAKEWLDRVRAAENHWEEKWFRRLRENQHYVRNGCAPDWVDDQGRQKYSTNLVLRHLMNTTAGLYAKNPTPEVVLHDRLDYMFFDGSQEQRLMAQTAENLARTTNQPIPMETALVIQDIREADQEKLKLKRTAKTIEIVLKNAMEVNDFRRRMRFQTFRAAGSSVAYIKYGYQREYGIRPEIDNQLEDVRTQIALLEHLRSKAKAGEIFEGDAQFEQLKLMEKRLLDERVFIRREGLVTFFPRTENIIVDPEVTNFDGFVGARWVAERMDFSAEDLERVYEVKLSERHVRPSGAMVTPPIAAAPGKLSHEVKNYVVYEIYDRDTGMMFTVCEGFTGFLKDPIEPPVEIEGFFPYVPLVLKDTDDPDVPVPPSEVDLMRDAQDDYNSAREGQRNHRYHNQPRHLYDDSSTDEETIARIAGMRPGEIERVRVQGDKKLSEVFIPRPTVPMIDTTYTTEPMLSDIARATNSPETAWQSGGTRASATEATIANDVRSSVGAQDSDRLDMCLSDLMNRMARLAIREMSEARVKSIVGPGASWPAPEEVDQVLERLRFSVKAGSSGKPQKTAELAKLERAMPLLFQVPELDYTRLAAALLETLDSQYDITDFIAPGQPSVMQMNSQTANGGGAMNGAQPQTAPGATPFPGGAMGRRSL